MSIDNRECNECGSSDWSKIYDKDYPERRRERDRTVETAYFCKNCENEGKHFEHRDGGTEQYTGALR